MDSPDLSRATWRTSSRSANGGNCVEITWAACPGGRVIAIRDSKDRSGPVLLFTPSQWRPFAASARTGEFDHPYARI
jgi:Domain of unknown function (DUF397)